MDKKNWIRLCLLLSVTEFGIANEDINSTVVLDSEDGKFSKVFSRRRRYLIFPDGSSFQLVFCTQNHGYIQIGDIIWLANTAALAWELPTDPNIFQFFIKSEKKFLEGNRRQDSKHIIYLDEDGRVISKKPYKRKFIVNPAFAKRSAETTAENNEMKTISKKNMHEAQKNRSLIQELDDQSLKFHRNTRKSLYPKIEKVLDGLGWSGKECLLRLLCEHGKIKKKQGHFLHEIMKAAFTFPRHASDHHEDYDLNHPTNSDCEALYPEC